MDLNTLLPSAQEEYLGKSPFSLVHFTRPWSHLSDFKEKQSLGEEDEDVFFDAFSNTLLLYHKGKFTLLDMYDPTYN